MSEEPDSFLVYSAINHRDVEAANQLVKKAGIALKNGEVMSSDLSNFLSEALLNIAEGMPARKALHLNVSKGRPQENISLKIFASVEFLSEALKWKKEAAFDYVSKLHHLSRESVVKHYYGLREVQDEVYVALDEKFTELGGVLASGAQLKFQIMWVLSGLPSVIFDEYLNIVRK